MYTTDLLYNHLFLIKILTCLFMLTRLIIFHFYEHLLEETKIIRKIIALMCFLVSAIYIKHQQFDYGIFWLMLSLCWIYLIKDEK